VELAKFVALTRVSDFDGRERDGERDVNVYGDSGRLLPGTTLPSLISLMGMTYWEWDEWTRGSAIRRAGYGGLKRNVAVALGNWGARAGEPPEEAVPVLVEARSVADPLVRGHAEWALGEIPSPSVPAALTGGAGCRGRSRGAGRDGARPRRVIVNDRPDNLRG
jgi:hypothetical protein